MSETLAASLANPEEMQALLQRLADEIGVLKGQVNDLQGATHFLAPVLVALYAVKPRRAALISLRGLEEVAEWLWANGWAGPVAEMTRRLIDDQITQIVGRQKPKLTIVRKEIIDLEEPA